MYDHYRRETLQNYRPGEFTGPGRLLAGGMPIVNQFAASKAFLMSAGTRPRSLTS
jgi:hypothetical protein